MTTQGELWTGLHEGDADNIRKWLYGSVLIRDWRADGSTSLEDFTVFADDGNLRTDLLSDSLPGGRFYEIGSITEDGVMFTPKFATEDTKIWQSRRSQRADITQDDEEVKFTAAESTPLIDYLRNNLPLANVPEVGTAGYRCPKPNATDTIYRQIIVIGVDGSTVGSDTAQYIAELRPRVSLTKVGDRTFNAKKIDGTELTYAVYTDPHSGFPADTLRGGPVWEASGGPVSLVANATVTATPVAGGKATLVFPEPVSRNDPFDYTVKQTTGGTTTTATLVGTPTTAADGTVTITVSGLTAASYTFVVTVEASDGQTASYPATAPITATP